MIDIPTGTYSVKRYEAGEWDTTTGEFSRGDESNFSILASIQPASGNQIKLLPEHRRTADTIVIYCEEKLNPSKEGAKIPVDIVVYEGENYEVFNVKNWASVTDIPHYEVIAVRQDRP